MNLHTYDQAAFKKALGIGTNEKLFEGHIHVTANSVIIETY